MFPLLSGRPGLKSGVGSFEGLDRLSLDQAVDWLRDILRAEAKLIGVSIRFVHELTLRATIDREVEVEVEDRDVPVGRGIIKRGTTRYQIQVGLTMPTKKSDLEDVLFTANRNELKPGIQRCLSSGGAFVLVLFGSHPLDVKAQEIVRTMKAVLEDNGVTLEGTIEVWRQQDLLTWVEPFPALRMRVCHEVEACQSAIQF